MIELNPHQQRMLQERDELASKTHALVKFFQTDIYRSLDNDEQCLMRMQHAAMLQYQAILHQRIVKFHP